MRVSNLRTIGAYLLFALSVAANLIFAASAGARELSSRVTELDHIPSIRPAYPVPDDPDMLFYIERSSNSNTVVYAAHLDSHGRFDKTTPLDVHWRWYNVDGHKKPLNFIERMMAYGVKSVADDGPGGAITCEVAALPERKIRLDLDNNERPEALMRFGDRLAKLVYVYLQVDDHGLMPNVTAMDLFGIDKRTGKPLQEHVIPH